MHINRLDHLVLTVRDIDATCLFYHRVLGMDVITFGQGRKALQFGHQKINLHPLDSSLTPKAAHPTPGSADLCFLTSIPLAQVMQHCAQQGVAVIAGPVLRTGATGLLQSIYVRDPDGNLLEIANEQPDAL